MRRPRTLAAAQSSMQMAEDEHTRLRDQMETDARSTLEALRKENEHQSMSLAAVQREVLELREALSTKEQEVRVHESSVGQLRASTDEKTQQIAQLQQELMEIRNQKALAIAQAQQDHGQGRVGAAA